MFRNPYADGLIVIVVLLLFFGPKRLPTLGRSLGTGLREFKDSITGSHDHEDEEERAALPPSSPAAAPVPPASEPRPEAQGVPGGSSGSAQAPPEPR